ncbi:MAG: fructose-bisphosphate aldolase [Archaeoglobus sp.]|nr:MAG: fructose-bisphosphate aldolase [Archaeoglobus sp.]
MLPSKVRANIKRASEIGKKLLLQRLIDGSSGNLSFREGNFFYITRTGAMLDELDETSFVRMEIWGNGKNPLASSDQLIHREVYRRSDFNSVLHCHGVYGVVLSFKKSEINPLDLEGRYFVGNIKVTTCNFGSESMAEAIVKELSKRKAVIVRGHGIYTAGRSIEEAYRLASYLEHTCEIICKLSKFSR